MTIKLLTYIDLEARWQIKVQQLRISVMKGELIPIKLGRRVRFSEKYISEIEENKGFNLGKK